MVESVTGRFKPGCTVRRQSHLITAGTARWTPVGARHAVPLLAHLNRADC